VAPRESYNILITEAHVAEDIPQVIRTWKGIIQRVDDLELKQFQIFQLTDKLTRSKQTLSSIRQTAFWRWLRLVLKSSRAAEN
jgi:hypothetical protein